MNGDVHEWLPAICSFYPGAGITPFTIWGLEVSWWLQFKASTEASIKAQKESRRGK